MRRCAVLLSLFLAVPATSASAARSCWTVTVGGNAVHTSAGHEACAPVYDGGVYCEEWLITIDNADEEVYFTVCVPF